MGTDTRSAREVVEFLVRSEHRLEILARLGDGPVPKRELTASVDAVRTTVQRNLDALEDRGLVRRRDRSYEATEAGTLIASHLQDLLETTAAGLDLQPALEVVAEANEAFDPDPEIGPGALVDARVVEATTENPYAPVREHEARLAETDHARLVLPASAPDPLETSLDAIEGGAVHEAVVTPDLAETLRTDPAFRETFEAFDASDAVRVDRYDGDISSYVGVLDDVVQIGVHDERGIPALLVESDDERVRSWAIDLFDAYRTASERIA